MYLNLPIFSLMTFGFDSQLKRSTIFKVIKKVSCFSPRSWVAFGVYLYIFYSFEIWPGVRQAFPQNAAQVAQYQILNYPYFHSTLIYNAIFIPHIFGSISELFFLTYIFLHVPTLRNVPCCFCFQAPFRYLPCLIFYFKHGFSC